MAGDPNANLDVFSFNLNVDNKTFDLFLHDTGVQPDPVPGRPALLGVGGRLPVLAGEGWTAVRGGSVDEDRDERRE